MTEPTPIYDATVLAALDFHTECEVLVAGTPCGGAPAWYVVCLRCGAVEAECLGCFARLTAYDDLITCVCGGRGRFTSLRRAVRVPGW